MHDSLIQTYLGRKSAAEIAPGFLAYLANLETVASVSAEVARSIVQELADQRRNIKLIGQFLDDRPGDLGRHAGNGLEIGEIGQESRCNLRGGLPAKIRLDQ